MNRILELREKRAKAWDAAKKFLDAKTGPDGLVSAEDSATYDKMEADVLALGKEVERLERQATLDLELSQPIRNPLTDKPGAAADKGLTAGDVITEAGQQPVTSLADLQARIKEARDAGRKSILLMVRRAGEPRFVALPVAS